MGGIPINPGAQCSIYFADFAVFCGGCAPCHRCVPDITIVPARIALFTRGACSEGTCVGTSYDSSWQQYLPLRYSEICREDPNEPILCRIEGRHEGDPKVPAAGVATAMLQL